MAEQGEKKRIGGNLGDMFGYVTDEDRNSWEAKRRPKKEGALKMGARTTADSMMRFGQQNMMAALSAEHRVAAQQAFDETHDRKTTVTDGKGRTQDITESVEYEDRKYNEDGTEESFELGG